MKTSAWLTVLLSLVLASCGTSRDDAAAASGHDPSLTPRTPLERQVPPNKCRLMATVLRVDSIFSLDAKDPCSQSPCRATITVDSILGYGQGFTQPLAQGQRVTARFAYTLAPTRSLFPKMTREYPGLAAGTTFVADVESTDDQSGFPKGALLLIYGYEIRSASKN